MVGRFDIESTKPAWALGYLFDIVLKGRDETPFEDHHHDD
jgi:protocatechuate 3,4-dioxygenase beta subunit